MTESDGASLGEQLLDCSRRNNTDLLDEILNTLNSDPAKIAELINNAKDPLGNTSLHLCSKNGSWEVLDRILDQEGGVEIDPVNSSDGDTPLHVAVRYALEEPDHGTFICENLIECGADPRIRNKSKLKPLDLVHGDELDNLIDLLQSAEIAANTGSVNEPEELIDEDEDEDEDTGV